MDGVDSNADVKVTTDLGEPNGERGGGRGDPNKDGVCNSEPEIYSLSTLSVVQPSLLVSRSL